MKAREPKLNLGHFDAESLNLRDWIYSNCANYDEAANLFCVSKRTVERWMAGQVNFPPMAARVVALYEERRAA